MPAVLLFGIPDNKDAKASGAYAANGIVQQAVRLLKKELPELLVITDVCLCEYMSHGHCGIVQRDKRGARILNDPTLETARPHRRQPRRSRRRHRRAQRHDGRPRPRHPRAAG